MGALPPRAGSCPRIPPEFAAIEVPTARAMVAAGVPAAQAARFGYAGGWIGRMLSAFAQ
jgi:hypothetical protein